MSYDHSVDVPYETSVRTSILSLGNSFGAANGFANEE